MDKRILITGAFGQLGDAVVQELCIDNVLLAVDIFVPDNVSGYYKSLTIDISDKNNVLQIIREFKPDIVINLAAMTDVDGCEAEPEAAHKVNVNSIRYFLDYHSDLFVQISTDYVFNGKNGPYDEEDKPDPINVYGKTKLLAEQLIQASSNPWITIRTNVVYDYTKRTKASFVKWVIDSLRVKKPIRVVDDQWNNPTYTVALAQVLRKMIDEGITGLYNYGGADYMHRLDFARQIAQVFNLDKSSLALAGKFKFEFFTVISIPFEILLLLFSINICFV